MLHSRGHVESRVRWCVKDDGGGSHGRGARAHSRDRDRGPCELAAHPGTFELRILAFIFTATQRAAPLRHSRIPLHQPDSVQPVRFPVDVFRFYTTEPQVRAPAASWRRTNRARLPSSARRSTRSLLRNWQNTTRNEGRCFVCASRPHPHGLTAVPAQDVP